MKRSVYFAVTCLLMASASVAQEFSFPEAAVTDPAALSKAMPELAKQVMAVYKDGDREIPRQFISPADGGGPI